MVLKRIVIHFFILMVLSVPAVAQKSDFHMLLWPEIGGWIYSATERNILPNQLRDSWFASRMPTYSGYDLKIHIPKTDSLKTYVEFILNQKPHCIEGEASFIEDEFNRNERIYIPILTLKLKGHTDENAEIVFHEKENWSGLLGVVHPTLPNAGKAQIEYWKEQTGEPANWIAFYSTEETIRHFLAGPKSNLNAVALPKQAMEGFLKKIDRMDLLNHTKQFDIPAAQHHQTLYLRRDLYKDLLIRTLITEKWLRNYFSSDLDLIF